MAMNYSHVAAEGQSEDSLTVPVDQLTPVAPESLAALSFWRCLPRTPGHAPLAKDCDLLNIPDLLPQCLLLDLKGDRDWPIRIFGTALVTHFGVDATGFNAFELYPPAQRETAFERLHTAWTRPAALLVHSRLASINGMPMTTEWVLMPLENESGDVISFLGSITVLDQDVDYSDIAFDGTLNSRRLVSLVFGDL